MVYKMLMEVLHTGQQVWVSALEIQTLNQMFSKC